VQLIKRFPGPNTALFWLLTHHYRWFLAWIAVIAIMAGYDDPIYRSSSVVVMPPVLLSTSLLAMSGRGLLSQLPLKTRRIADLELLFVALTGITGTLLFWATLWSCSPSELWPTNHVALLLLSPTTLIAFRTAQALDKVFGTLFLCTALPFLVILSGFTSFEGSTIPMTWALVLAILTIFVARTLYHWSVGQVELDDSIPTRSVPAGNTPITAPVSTDPEPTHSPFSTRAAATRWFILRRLVSLAGNPGIWAMAFLFPLMPRFFHEQIGTSDYFFMDLLSVLGVTYLMTLWYLENLGAVRNLPVSLWTRTRHHGEILLLGLVALTGLGWLLLLANGDFGPNLLWVPWALWAGISLAPVIAIPIVGFFLVDPGYVDLEIMVPLFTLAYLLILLLTRDTIHKTIRLRDIVPLLIPFALSGLGLCLLPPSDFAVGYRWMLREFLGVTVTLACLRFAVGTGHLPKRVAWRTVIGIVVGLGIVASLSALDIVPKNPGGLYALFLELGIVAPIFLPVALMPFMIEWARTNDKYRDAAKWDEAARWNWERMR